MKNPGNSTIVALFVRVPVPGRVKTRLASDLGNDGACSLYRAMVADILFNIMACDIPLYLFHDGKDGSELPKEWTEASSKVIVQKGESVGDRMAAAFEHCFAENIKQVILVGSDIPGLDSQLISAASVALNSHDAAIAPAFDGGYCLIAMSQETYQQNIFRDIPWSTDLVIQATLERCEEYKIEVEILKILQDIDTIDDLKAYCRNYSCRAFATNSWLVSAGFMQKCRRDKLRPDLPGTPSKGT